MCLAVPMQLVEITDDGIGKVDSAGVKAAVNITMIPHARVGDYLIIHAGFGIEVLDREEAEIRLDLFKELAAACEAEEEA